MSKDKEPARAMYLMAVVAHSMAHESAHKRRVGAILKEYAEELDEIEAEEQDFSERVSRTAEANLDLEPLELDQGPEGSDTPPATERGANGPSEPPVTPEGAPSGSDFVG